MDRVRALQGNRSINYPTSSTHQSALTPTSQGSGNLLEEDSGVVLNSAALFAERLNNVRATLIEQCLEQDELDEALKQANTLIAQKNISHYHRGIALFAIATVYIPKAMVGELAPNIESCLQAVIISFNYCANAMNAPETRDTQGIDNDKLARWMAKATALIQEWRRWMEERARGEANRQAYAEIMETTEAEIMETTEAEWDLTSYGVY